MSSQNMRIGIFIATMTGLADMCAEEIASALSQAGIPCDRIMMDGLNVSAFDPYDLIVVVSSTYGHGEIPDNGQALFSSLAGGADLSGKRYGVFALGDRTYADTFCAAGDRWDMALLAAGAVPFIETKRHDASGGTLAEDVAGQWAARWAETLA